MYALTGPKSLELVAATLLLCWADCKFNSLSLALRFNDGTMFLILSAFSYLGSIQASYLITGSQDVNSNIHMRSISM